MAEDLGGVTGKEITTAVSLGVDLVARLRLAWGIRVGHIAWGAATFSSAAVTGKLLRLNENELRNAPGLAYSQSAGPLQSQLDGTLNLRVQHGMAVEAGVRSAFLERSGVDGIQNFLEGRFGLYSAYFLDQWTPHPIIDDLGNDSRSPMSASSVIPVAGIFTPRSTAFLKLSETRAFPLRKSRGFGSRSVKMVIT